jgi:hypothetical protein
MVDRCSGAVAPGDEPERDRQPDKPRRVPELCRRGRIFHQFSSRMTLTSSEGEVGFKRGPDGARTIIVARLAVEYWLRAITVMRTGVNRRPRRVDTAARAGNRWLG